VKVLGDKIRDVRKKQKISQRELSKGICTQATISNIENKNSCDSLDIFSKICKRLGLEVEACMILPDEYLLTVKLDEVEQKCRRFKHAEAWDILKQVSIDEVSSKNRIIARYNYYLGVTSLMAKKDYNEALFFLHRAKDIVQEDDLYCILSENELGVLYTKQNQIEKAKVYYNHSIELLRNYQGAFDSQLLRVYFNSAKFFNLIQDFEQGKALAEKGINLNKRKDTNYCLELLYYEMGWSKLMLKESAVLDYKIAYYLSIAFKNYQLKKVIDEDIKLYGLGISLEENLVS
jgi:transcriptional regulator with XRE-family HTH domain